MQYEELNLHEHTLKRPDTYVGSVHAQVCDEYIVENNTFVKQTVEYVPAVFRLFIEAVSNAVDNIYRSNQYDVPCKSIRVTISPSDGWIRVWNDGLTIPIRKHEKTGVWIPEMLFGRLLTSSNYNDEEKRETSGRNGLGISLTNIFSSEFSIELVDSGKKYVQEWKRNMRERSDPKITSVKKKGYTCVAWKVDFTYFGLTGYSDTFVSLLYKYVYDTSMIASKYNVSVYLNDEKCPIKHFKDYSKMYVQGEEKEKEWLYFVDENSQCVCMASDNGYEEISFVNGIRTKNGGAHVNSWTDVLLKAIVQKVQSKHKQLKLTVRDIKPYFRFIVECTLPNPTFSTQSKDELVSPGLSIKTDTSRIDKVLQWGFMEHMRDLIDAKDKSLLKKSESKRMKRIDGFDPANKAGGKDANKCTLILCEGMSAKTYAVMGIEQGTLCNGQHLKGRDWYGIMPLRGVVMNVRNATTSSILANKEIVNVIQALGVQYDMDYSVDANYRRLRYGRIMILTDADCFPENTPLLTRDVDGTIRVQTIAEVYESEDTYQVWSEHGWTTIREIQCKPSTKDVYTILTREGVFQCTSDHRCLLVNGEERRAIDLKVGDVLLTTENLPSPSLDTHTTMKADMAWMWGVMMIVGTRRREKYLFLLPEHLSEKFVQTFESVFGEPLLVKTKESEHSPLVLLTTECIHPELEEMFGYTKRVPSRILNGSVETLEMFYRGCMDVQRDSRFYFQHELGAQGFVYVLQRLGKRVNVSFHKYNPNVLVVEIQRVYTSDGPAGEIVEIRIRSNQEGMVKVYDVETESHSLQVGVGTSVVHNCDGIHIQALILNVFHHLFPTLFHRKGFLTCMSTPIMKIQYKNDIHRFYDMTSANRFIEKHAKKPLQIKYYKGLGTSSDKDVKETFGQRVIQYTVDEKTTDSMVLAFDKHHANTRKHWLTEYRDKEVDLRQEGEEYRMDISEFVNVELIKFSRSDCIRSIPHLMDGFKESQRKILYACIKKNLTSQPMKVAQLAGYVAENTNYHHGEGCLFDTITKMAQDFIGSNNLPLLLKDGQFGTRMQPNGSDAANARYIFTKLQPYTRSIFHPADDAILTYLNDDGDTIEPEYYAPIIPTILVNGAHGIATGWSTSIPSFHPRHLMEWIRCFLDGKDIFPELIPYYHGFQGRIRVESTTKFITEGCYERQKGKLFITELPIGVWIDKYKEYLEELLENRKIKSLKNYSKPDKVYFEITEFPDQPLKETTLKLSSTLNLSNMVLFDEQQRIRRYTKVEEILESFCQERLRFYQTRKTHQLNVLKRDLTLVNNKILFLSLVMTDKIHIFRETDERIVAQCQSHHILKVDDSYDYLLTLPLKTFSREKWTAFETKKEELEKQLHELEKSTPKKMWKRDLDVLESKLPY